MFVIITGGGTGGHVYPGLALAEALVARGHPRDELHWVGSARGLEADVVPAAGLSVDLLPGRGLQRRLTMANVGVIVGSIGAFGRALAIVRRRRPAVVVGVGGYASLPTLVAARLCRVPAVVHEQNAAPGLANRVAVRLGARPATSLPDTPLAGAVLTGNPVREAVAGVERRPSGRQLVGIVGGSLGARTLNRAALGLYDRWRGRTDVTLHVVTGTAGHQDTLQQLAGLHRPGDVLDHRVVRYENDMGGLYAAAAVLVCRAGATTVAELAAAGVPSVLVPLPGAPGDHQTRNARSLERAGGAVVIEDRACDGARLAGELDKLLADPVHLKRMGDAARTLARPDAADRLADLVEAAAPGAPA